MNVHDSDSPSTKAWKEWASTQNGNADCLVSLEAFKAGWHARTPAIADGSDLFICRRTVAGDNRDGATRYYVYQELRPYDGAIADGVGVEDYAAMCRAVSALGHACSQVNWPWVQETATRYVQEIERAADYLMDRTPPQAATDEGVDNG